MLLLQHCHSLSLVQTRIIHVLKLDMKSVSCSRVLQYLHLKGSHRVVLTQSQLKQPNTGLWRWREAQSPLKHRWYTSKENEISTEVEVQDINIMSCETINTDSGLLHTNIQHERLTTSPRKRVRARLGRPESVCYGVAAATSFIT